MEHLEWKFNDFCEQPWQDYIVLAVDQGGKGYFAVGNLQSDLAAIVGTTILTDKKALATVERVIKVFTMGKDEALEILRERG